MKTSIIATGVLAISLLASCVSTKKFKAEQASALVKYEQLNATYSKLQDELKACTDDRIELNRKNTGLQAEIDGLNKHLAFVKENNTQALKQLQDLSVISSAQADNIKKSLENIGAKDAYIQTLQESTAREDSLNMAVVMNLKGAIGN